MKETIYENTTKHNTKIAVIGLGYVGLPIAVAFSKKIEVVGFDVNQDKINAYKAGIDVTGDVGNQIIKNCSVNFTSDAEELSDCNFYIIAVPTPIKNGNLPDLKYVQNASEIVGKKLSKDDIVVFESTVYPGVTEDVCVPILEKVSGFRCGVDFKVGYSPERINPGDKVHRLESIVKIVSGIDEEALEKIAAVYELIIEAGVYKAESIKVAEAAKVIENAQRDINIAFMNELSMLFHEMNIDTLEVIKAASTKWNFMNFTPGLVGGHCIGIDPYYLTYKAEDEGYRSKIILAGRHVNDGMGKYIAQQVIKELVRLKMNLHEVKIGFLGISYKEDCSDIRNTKVIDIINELMDYGITSYVFDDHVNKEEVLEEYGIQISEMFELQNVNVVIVAVPHREYKEMSLQDFERLYDTSLPKLMVDIKGIYNKKEFEENGYTYWRL